MLLSPNGFIGAEAMGYLSPEGQAHSFGAGANGFVRSEGVGAVILKPLQQAIEDRDHIYALIKGTGVSHGGRGMSLTAPSGIGMRSAITQACRAAGIDPRTVSYIEAHGTAFPLGDGIEIDALKSGYQEIAVSYSRNEKRVIPYYISSLKPCIGHGEIVSGMAALLKAVLAIRHHVIPGVPRFAKLHEHVSLDGSPFRITAENHSWEALHDDHGTLLPPRVGLNCYGFGGVNAHVIVEEYIPPQTHSDPKEKIVSDSTSSPQIVIFSAKNRIDCWPLCKTCWDMSKSNRNYHWLVWPTHPPGRTRSHGMSNSDGREGSQRTG